MVEVPAYHHGTCFRAEHGRIDFQVIDARDVDLPLPQTHGMRNRCVGQSSGLSARGASPFHNGLDRAAHAHEQDRQTAQPPRAVREDPPRDGVGVVVADVHDDIQPHAAAGGDGLIERAIQGRNQRLDVLAFAAGCSPIPGK